MQPYDPDDKDQKFHYQQQQHANRRPWLASHSYAVEERVLFGICGRTTCYVVFGLLVVVLFFFAAVLFGTGTSELATLTKPDPSDDEEGPDDGGFSLGGVFEEILREQQGLAERADAVRSPTDCPAGQRLIMTKNGANPSGTNDANKGGVCARVLYYPNVIDVDFMDPEADACADFYQYACGAFVQDERNVGNDATFSYLYTKNMERLYDIIQNDHEGRVGHFYQSCLLEQGEARGHERSSVWLDVAHEVLGGGKEWSLEERMAHMATHDMMLPLRFSLELNPISATTAIPTLIRAGLDTDTVGSSRIARIYRIRSVLEMVPDSVIGGAGGDNVVAERAEFAADIEEAVEEAWTSSQSMLEQQQWGYSEYLRHLQSGKENHPGLMRYSELRSTLRPWFDTDAFFHAYDPSFQKRLTDSTLFWVMNREYLQNTARLLSGHTAEAWKAYFAYSLVASTMHDEGASSEDGTLLYTYQHDFDPSYALPWYRPLRFSVSEQLSMSSRHYRCVQLTQAYLPVLLDGLFVESVRDEMGSEQWELARSMALDTARQVQFELAHELRELGTDAGVAAAKKVEAIDVTVAVPRLWDRDGHGLMQERDRLHIGATDTFVDNVMRIRAFHQWLMMYDMAGSVVYSSDSQGESAVIGLDAHRMFDSLVHQVNAFYVPSLNAIVINAGIMAPPVFSGLYDPVSRFAKLGMILGHEMSHSIDMSGSHFDQFGSFHPWLSSAASDRYEHNAQCFVEAYTKRTALGNMHDGQMTLNENIADIAGFRAAYNAMFEQYNVLDGGGKDHARLNAYKRQFFISYAQLWCKSTDVQSERNYIHTSVHSVSELRVNQVVRQHADFARVFQCPKESFSICTSIS